MNQWILQCRPGFENECLAEIITKSPQLAQQGTLGHEGGWLAVPLTSPLSPWQAAESIPYRQLAFTRQSFAAIAWLQELTAGDRLSPLQGVLAQLTMPVQDIWLETPDTNPGKGLQALARALEPGLRQFMQEKNLLSADSPYRLHLLVLTSTSILLGVSHRDHSSPNPMGIPRLRLAKEAPSRAALKLEEAVHHFLSPEERKKALRPGLHAVDLGAAPGGWSWYLCQQGVKVIAVDNGPLQPALAASPLITHLREDGFAYTPRRPVDWLCCDMVEQPRKVAALVGRWFAAGHCRHAIFNLKMPMKKRWQELQLCETLLQKSVQKPGKTLHISFKQLYHDREEVTGYVHIG
ncbi:MAG: 23S rRNA (cytidine(2498)-2'-O)-methyltransferase RlmM [Magnetococcales bacterium]|nr:23S rRNA (cytidine(2498)-2'-O)-methyltransferase RlmM [Magnetococcales bacterium]NGZ27303.1 23S rRNA (cytidine(2498)-2'-O)-methyltransferase RlmM [Magnetococcales bacterium]